MRSHGPRQPAEPARGQGASGECPEWHRRTLESESVPGARLQAQKKRSRALCTGTSKFKPSYRNAVHLAELRFRERNRRYPRPGTSMVPSMTIVGGSGTKFGVPVGSLTRKKVSAPSLVMLSIMLTEIPTRFELLLKKLYVSVNGELI